MTLMPKNREHFEMESQLQLSPQSGDCAQAKGGIAIGRRSIKYEICTLEKQ